MKKTSALLLAAFLAGASSACNGNHLLVGNDPDGSAGAAGHTGNGGTAGHGANGATAGNGGMIPVDAGGTNLGSTAGNAGTADDGGAFDGAGTTLADAGQSWGTGGAPSYDLDGGNGGARGLPLQISGAEAVTRVASVLWQAQPDADLLLQAAHVTTTQDLYDVIHQMLGDARAAKGVGAFYRWWLNLDALATTSKDATVFPAYTPTLQADMANETETFGVNVTLAMNGTFGTLMTAPFSFINADLAAIYGVSGVTGTDLRQVGLDSTQRAGLLTQPGLQALGSIETRNDPSRRGALVTQSVLCTVVPSPPANLPALVIPAGVTVRAALAQSTSPASCGACHTRFDPPGLAYETFDAIGRFRTTDNGAPVDVSGLAIENLDPSSGGSRPFSGPIALAADLAASVTAQQCMTKQWLAFALGKTPSDLTDGQWTAAYQTFVSTQLSLQELITAVLMSDTFLAPK
ncbi:MAG TPA: DUF1592 domain-containing protein [Polyangia bacterium]|jgi:hypothetical protein|nr:DUF1592 domain-containing protein [Polyangia bacterium]